MGDELMKIFQDGNRRTENILSPYACKNSDAWRRKEEKKDDFRSSFAVDRDRILYSGAYRRYQGKTQVFSFTNLIDEEMTNRSLHTTYVSQIARTIGKVLKLNLEAIEAIALGHDLGHTPFGHEGERALDECCIDYEIGRFRHNVASLFIVDYITKRGEGLNLTFQVRDGIISHDGEVHNRILIPDRKKTEEDIQDYVTALLFSESDSESNSDSKTNSKTTKITDNETALRKEWMPSTLEGCVVRISDTIAYIGQDIEDAIRHGVLERDELPKDCVAYFGNTNSEIVDKLITDIVLNSYEQDYIALSEPTSEMLEKLKDFNYRNIYNDPRIKEYTKKVSRAMKILFAKYLDDIEKEEKTSKIFIHFLNYKSKAYLDKFSEKERVRDFIATMTDRYFNEEIKEYMIPWKY